jgi:acetyltransferase
MAEYPAHLARTRRLADGREVVIRPIRQHDEVREHPRLVKCASAVTSVLAHFFTGVDYDRHMAFVCEAGGDAGPCLVGEARYVANLGRRNCEFGIVVADDWQRAGIAQLLADALIRAARARGLETMEALVLGDNPGMLALARSLDFELLPAPDQPALLRVVKKL